MNENEQHIVRQYACASLQGMLAVKGIPMTQEARDIIVRQAWLLACDMRIVELENGGD
jgi:hypothetical protein